MKSCKEENIIIDGYLSPVAYHSEQGTEITGWVPHLVDPIRKSAVSKPNNPNMELAPTKTCANAATTWYTDSVPEIISTVDCVYEIDLDEVKSQSAPRGSSGSVEDLKTTGVHTEVVTSKICAQFRPNMFYIFVLIFVALFLFVYNNALLWIESNLLVKLKTKLQFYLFRQRCDETQNIARNANIWAPQSRFRKILMDTPNAPWDLLNWNNPMSITKW